MNDKIDVNFELTDDDYQRFSRQTLIVLNHLATRRELQVEEARELYRINRLACSINVLRGAGHVILTDRGDDNQAVYYYYGFSPDIAKMIDVKPMHQETVRQCLLKAIEYYSGDIRDFAKEVKETPKLVDLIPKYKGYLVDEMFRDDPEEKAMLDIVLNILKGYELNLIQKARVDEIKKHLLKEKPDSK